jgi:hypothetical protein
MTNDRSEDRLLVIAFARALGFLHVNARRR